MMKQIDELMNSNLFMIGENSITVAKVIFVLLCLFLTWVASKLAQLMVRRAFQYRGIVDERRVGVVIRLVHYLVVLAGVTTALQLFGIDFGTLFAAGAIFAVGIGFAMQSIAQNFVAGVLLLLERTIKPGDVLEVKGRVVKVISMGIRATIMQTHDAEDMIVPNAELIQSTVKNYTLDDTSFRIRTSVGVAYESDMKHVKEVLFKVAKQENEKWGKKKRPCWAVIKEFGDSSVSFEVGIWVKDPWQQTTAIAELREAIWWGLKEDAITIAFPQLDVHLNHVNATSNSKPSQS